METSLISIGTGDGGGQDKNKGEVGSTLSRLIQVQILPTLERGTPVDKPSRSLFVWNFCKGVGIGPDPLLWVWTKVVSHFSGFPQKIL